LWIDPRLNDRKYLIPNDPLRHFNSANNDIIVQNTLPAVEAALARLQH
jgi:hypothetical protein